MLKILNHSTVPASSSSTSASTDRYHSANNQNDALGLLLGLDLSGTAEIADCFALPALSQSADVEKNGAAKYAQSVLEHLREVSTIDSPIGVYLSSHTLSSINSSAVGGADEKGMLGTGSGFLTRQVVELMQFVEKIGGARTGKGGSRAVLVVHDAARSVGGDISVKAYKFSEGFAAALATAKFDTLSLIEHRLTPATMLTPLALRTKTSAALNALLASLSAPPAPSQLSSITSSPFNASALPTSFLPLQNSISTSLPASLSTVLASLSTLNQEQNNLAYNVRVVSREKARHEQAVAKRQEENEQRKKQGMQPLPEIVEPVGKKIQDPSRLDALFALGAVDQAAKGLAAEAGKGLVKVFTSS